MVWNKSYFVLKLKFWFLLLLFYCLGTGALATSSCRLPQPCNLDQIWLSPLKYQNKGRRQAAGGRRTTKRNVSKQNMVNRSKPHKSGSCIFQREIIRERDIIMEVGVLKLFIAISIAPASRSLPSTSTFCFCFKCGKRQTKTLERSRKIVFPI